MRIICVKLKDRHSFHSCTTCNRAPSWINEKDSGTKDHDEECRVKISDIPENVDIQEGCSLQLSSDRTEIVIPYIGDNDGCGVYQNCPLWIPKKQIKTCMNCKYAPDFNYDNAGLSDIGICAFGVCRFPNPKFTDGPSIFLQCGDPDPDNHEFRHTAWVYDGKVLYNYKSDCPTWKHK